MARRQNKPKIQSVIVVEAVFLAQYGCGMWTAVGREGEMVEGGRGRKVAGA